MLNSHAAQVETLEQITRSTSRAEIEAALSFIKQLQAAPQPLPEAETMRRILAGVLSLHDQKNLTQMKLF